jgi:hypothetical protein
MSKEVIHTHGEDRLVREDTAKAFRGVNWMILSLIGFVVILLIVAATFFLRAGADGGTKTPGQIENGTTR